MMAGLSEEHSPGTGADIGVIDLDGEPGHEAWLATRSYEEQPVLSFDGQWLAWVSDATGSRKVYVRSFGTEGARMQVSRDGSGQPFGPRDGRTLFFWLPVAGGSTRALMAANVRVGTMQPAATPDHTRPTSLEFETPKKLFDLPVGPYPNLSAYPDGERFLAHMPLKTEGNDTAVIHVMLNAHERLKEIAPVPDE